MPIKSDFIAPEFGVWAEKSVILARAMTKWLYADRKANPTWNKPEMWANGPKVKIVRRALNFVDIGSGDAPTQKLSLIGGKNCIVFGRSATVKLHAAPGSPLQIPNEYGSYVLMQQESTAGFQDIQQMPLNNCCGLVPGWPDYSPAPEFWLGNSDKVIVITNNWGADIDVNLSWSVAMLDTAS